MPNKWEKQPFRVGTKQSSAAVADGLAIRAFVAENADEHIVAPFRELCRKNGVPTETVPTCLQLGKTFGISVGAACAVLLKQR